ncbi:MAG: carbohydrate ABC transporter permease [Ruminococcaceae bacterium]|nr:carbohydrate ABC transporter permease [Oscillospiraceae bacterium]
MSKITTKRVSRSRWGNFLVAFFLGLLGVFMILPIYYSIISALKPLNELFYFPPRFYVVNPTLNNFLSLIKLQAQSEVPFERYIFNSVLVALVSTVGYVLIASMAAYPLAKHKFPLKKLITNMVVFAILFRPEVTSIPQYIMMSGVNIIDTYLALILPAMAGSFGVFLLQQFLETVPNELIESGRIDGAGELSIFFRLIMPMIKPAWMTVVIFTFISTWNINGVQFIYSENMKMLPAMLSSLSTAGIARTGVASAVSVLLLIPPVIIFLFSQSSIVETMAHSGLKG